MTVVVAYLLRSGYPQFMEPTDGVLPGRESLPPGRAITATKGQGKEWKGSLEGDLPCGLRRAFKAAWIWFLQSPSNFRYTSC